MLKIALISFLFTQSTLANTLSSCGEYNARGIIRPKSDGVFLIVNEKSNSEYSIRFSIREQAKLGPYFDQPVAIKLILDKKFDGTKGESQEIISVENRIPNPLNPKDTGFDLLKKLECRKD